MPPLPSTNHDRCTHRSAVLMKQRPHLRITRRFSVRPLHSPFFCASGHSRTSPPRPGLCSTWTLFPILAASLPSFPILSWPNRHGRSSTSWSRIRTCEWFPCASSISWPWPWRAPILHPRLPWLTCMLTRARNPPQTPLAILRATRPFASPSPGVPSRVPPARTR